MRWIVLFAFCAVPSMAHAATVRPLTTLHAQVVRLKDLFDNAGPDADRVLGPAPAPGGQIVVEASQLAYIARRYGVSWQPDAGAERAVLDRPGRPLAEAEVMAPLRTALTTAGQPQDAEVTLTGFTAPTVPTDTKFAVDVSSLQIDPAQHRFSGLLTIGGPALNPISVPVAGRVEAVQQVVVAVSGLAAGSVLQAGDLRLAEVRISRLPKDPVRRIADAVGLAVRDPVAQDQPIPRGELGEPVMVRKGARVVMHLDGPGLALTGEAVALEAGGRGELIRVQNPNSRAVLQAQVIDLNTVRVEPGGAQP